MAFPNSSRLQRNELIREATNDLFDVAIVGGGIHGAFAAREAAMRGFRVLLLEARDYAFGTSSRCSKLLHGGVRYLEQGNVGLVYEAVRERDRLMNIAGHLTRAQKILFPIQTGKTRPAWQIRIGLGLYDAFAGVFTRGSQSPSHTCHWHRRLVSDSKEYKTLQQYGLEFSDLFAYYDGQMDDSRIVVECVVDARELGVTTLNYAEVQGAARVTNGSKQWALTWRDELEGVEHISNARVLLNCTGPWVPRFHRDILPAPENQWRPSWPTPVLSRGIHLVFADKKLEEGLILPTPESGRYYFVLPYFSAADNGVLLGTTDRLVEENEDNPQARQDEIDELLGYVANDLPEAGLTRSALTGSFCGTRILASKGGVGSGKASAISRSLKILEQDGYVALLGGKYTTARRTAELLLDKVEAQGTTRGRTKRDLRELRNRKLPGARDWSMEQREHLADALMKKVSAVCGQEEAMLDPILMKRLRQEALIAVDRFGTRAQEFLKDELLNHSQVHKDPLHLLRTLQVRYAMDVEQAHSFEDAFERRLGYIGSPEAVINEENTRDSS